MPTTSTRTSTLIIRMCSPDLSMCLYILISRDSFLTWVLMNVTKVFFESDWTGFFKLKHIYMCVCVYVCMSDRLQRINDIQKDYNVNLASIR